MNNDSFSHNNEQFVLSYELLRLLQWLAQHDGDKLKKIVSKAVANGLHDSMEKIDTINEYYLVEDMQHSIVDFFELIEQYLHEAINEHVSKKAREKKLLPTIDQIDSTFCDDATVRFSVEKATKKNDHNPNISAREQLFKELLKRWKPHNKNIMN